MRTCRQVSSDGMQGSVLKPLAVSVVPFDLGEPQKACCRHSRIRCMACAPPGSGGTKLTTWCLEAGVRSGPRSWRQPYERRITGEHGLTWSPTLGKLCACPLCELAPAGVKGQVPLGSVAPGRATVSHSWVHSPRGGQGPSGHSLWAAAEEKPFLCALGWQPSGAELRG